MTTAEQEAQRLSIQQEKRYKELLLTMVNNDRATAIAKAPPIADVFKLLDVADDFASKYLDPQHRDRLCRSVTHRSLFAIATATYLERDTHTTDKHYKASDYRECQHA